MDYGADDYNPIKEKQRKYNHNEAEKKRVRNINKCVDDLKAILDNANVSHKADKVSTLEATVAYMRDLIKERDRLTANLGYISTLVSEGVDYDNENSIVSDNDDNHFLGKSINPSDLQATGIHMEEEDDDDKPCVYTEQSDVVGDPISEAPDVPCKKEEVESHVMKEASKINERNGIDYKGIWLNNNMPCVVAEIQSGKLLKGNLFFMKLFQYASMEEVNELSFFDIIAPSDLPIFWSEYCQLVNAHHQMSRSFVSQIRNPKKDIQLPCFITLGSIMDFEEHVFQVSATFTPLQEVETEGVKTATNVNATTNKLMQTPTNVNISKFLK